MPKHDQNDEAVDLSDIRWKMLVACDTCRRRKVRCDGQRPCLKCSKGGKACTFSTPRRVVIHPSPARALKRPRTDSLSPRPSSPKTWTTSNTTSQGSISRSPVSRIQNVGDGFKEETSQPKISSPSRSGKEHLLLIDSDDQIVYSGPSTDMPLFARLGLLHTVEVSESDKTGTDFASHSADALGITGATTSSGDCFDICLRNCPQELMIKLIGHHLSNPIFFPLLHSPSFLSEFTAITHRRLSCTAQYGALLMGVLAVTVRLVESARALLPPSERHQAGEAYFELAQDFLRASKNKLDIRYILALYRWFAQLLPHLILGLTGRADLALFAEGRSDSAGQFPLEISQSGDNNLVLGSVSSFIAEAVGLAFTTGLHRSTVEFKMDPVTLQIRTRLFWALYTLDTTLAYSQGRPPLIRLSECSVDLPVIVDNEYIKKTEILPQPGSDPPLAIAAAVKMIEIYMVLEQVSSAINAPSRTPADAYSLGDLRTSRSRLMKRARMRLDEIEQQLPPYLSQVSATPNATLSFLFSCRVRTVLQFVRTLVARQALIDELESGVEPTGEEASLATLEACRLSVDTVKTYSRLRHLGLLPYCGFYAVSHVTAAGHTLIACMLRSANLALEHRPDLLTAIDILLVFSSLFPHAKTVAQLLVQLSRNLDHNHGSNTQSEAVAIRVLARRMARSPSAEEFRRFTPALSWPSWKGDFSERIDAEPLFKQAIRIKPPTTSTSFSQPYAVDSTYLPAHRNEPTIFSATDTELSWPSSTAAGPLEPQWMSNASDHTVWGHSFSFLNDGLFSKL
ncbi:hypothetical protein G7046_g2399 [Stylonectria norvegica]|nr:hypothetical protein G7046_g2399 [Stylonectria norvegica]